MPIANCQPSRPWRVPLGLKIVVLVQDAVVQRGVTVIRKTYSGYWQGSWKILLEGAGKFLCVGPPVCKIIQDSLWVMCLCAALFSLWVRFDKGLERFLIEHSYVLKL